MTIVQSDSIRSKSHLPIFGGFSWVKSSHCNKNPSIQEFHLRVKGFPMQILQRVGVGHLNTLLNLKVTSVWAVLHTSLYYWKLKNFQNENFLIIYSPPCHPRCSCLSFFGCKEIMCIACKQILCMHSSQQCLKLEKVAKMSSNLLLSIIAIFALTPYLRRKLTFFNQIFSNILFH